MNVTAYVGSPRRKGNTATIVEAICEAAEKRGAETKTFFVADWDMHCCTGGRACARGEVDICAFDDDFTVNAPSLVGADAIIVASPVYFGMITGPLKTFLDRWCTFFDEEFRMRIVPGKKLVTVTTSAAPAKQFEEVNDYLVKWFGSFFKMEHVGRIVAGECREAGDVQGEADILDAARGLAERL